MVKDRVEVCFVNDCLKRLKITHLQGQFLPSLCSDLSLVVVELKKMKLYKKCKNWLKVSKKVLNLIYLKPSLS